MKWLERVVWIVVAMGAVAWAGSADQLYRSREAQVVKLEREVKILTVDNENLQNGAFCPAAPDTGDDQ